MSEREERERKEHVRAIQSQWRDAVHGMPLHPEEVISAAAEWLVIIILSMSDKECEAHEILNRTTEISHTYINENWRDSRIAKEKAGRQ